MLIDGIVLGHRISAKGIQVDTEKIKVILKKFTLCSQKEVQFFLGYVDYYHRFIKNFSRISHPFFAFLNKYSKFLWTESFQHALEELKTKVSKDPILRGPDWSLPLHISTDASNTTIRVVLGKN